MFSNMNIFFYKLPVLNQSSSFKRQSKKSSFPYSLPHLAFSFFIISLFIVPSLDSICQSLFILSLQVSFPELFAVAIFEIFLPLTNISCSFCQYHKLAFLVKHSVFHLMNFFPNLHSLDSFKYVFYSKYKKEVLFKYSSVLKCHLFHISFFIVFIIQVLALKLYCKLHQSM